MYSCVCLPKRESRVGSAVRRALDIRDDDDDNEETKKIISASHALLLLRCNFSEGGVRRFWGFGTMLYFISLDGWLMRVINTYLFSFCIGIVLPLSNNLLEGDHRITFQQSRNVLWNVGLTLESLR